MIDVVGPLEAAVAEASERGGAPWLPFVQGRCTCGRQIGLVGRCGPEWAWQWLSLVPSRADQHLKSLQRHATVRDEHGDRTLAPPVGMLSRVRLVDLSEDAPRVLRAYCADSCHRIQHFGLVKVVLALREATSPTGSPVSIGPASTT